MNRRPRPTVVVFCKAPVPGRVKTRLLGALDPDEAAALGTSMLLDVLWAIRSKRWRVVASVAREEDRGPVAALVGPSVDIYTQPAGGLGERMAGEISRHGAAGAWVAIVGSDCPQISTDHVASAFGALDDGADAAICPAADGGYSLIACRGECAPLFRDIPWSTGGVRVATRRAADRAGLRLDEVAPLDDVDRPEDLTRLVGEDTVASPIAARTRAVAVALRNKRPELAFSD